MIKKGSQVKFHYTLKVDGDVVDSSREREPLGYVHGEGQIVEGLESELEGMTVGDKKSASVSPERGYGEHRAEAVQAVPKTAFADLSTLKVGDMVQGQSEGQAFQAAVVGIDEDTVSLDLNHPLAGKTLHFDVEIVSID